MKKVKNTFLILMLLLVFMMPNITSYASVMGEVETYCEVKISVEVPDGFNEEITVTLEEQESLVRKAVILSKENGFTDSIWGLAGNYNAYVRYSGNGKWTSDIKESYKVAGTYIDLQIVVKDGSLANNVLDSDDEGGDTLFYDEDIDITTNLVKGSVFFKNFIEKLSFMQNDNAYEDFLMIYDAKLIKKSYTEAHELNTSERWDAMSDFEKFIWVAGYLRPNAYLYKADTLEDYMDDAIVVELTMLKNNDYPNEDILQEALYELSEWHYKFFKETGMVYDYYNLENGNYTEDSEENKEPLTTEEEMENEKDTTVSDDTETKEPKDSMVVSVLKKSMVSIILALGIGAVYFFAKKKNISNMHDKIDK